MKSKTIILLFLLLGVAMPRLSAQLPPVLPDDTRSVVWTLEYPGYWEDVYCNGEYVETLTGDIYLKETDHFKDGVMMWGIAHLTGKMTSVNSDEVFTLHETVKGFPPVNEDGNYTNGTWQFNIVGDQGTHYICKFSFFDHEPFFTVDRSVCPGKKK